jgi:tetratricopeptide (TPR) repeat protein
MLRPFLANLSLSASVALVLGASGCTSMNTIRQATVRNSAEDVGPSRESRSVALAREFDRRRDDAQFQAAASAWQRGDLDGCHKLIDQLLERNPADRRSRLMLADVLLFSGQTAQAADELSKLVADDPKDAVAQHAFAEVLDAIGRPAEAIGHHEEAARLEPKNELYAQSATSARNALASLNSATTQSSQPTQPAGSADSQDAHTPLERAAAALAANDAQQAIEAATQGLSQTPDQAEPLYRVLGTAYYRHGDYAAAQSALSQALSLDKSDALAYFLQGHVLDKLGQTDAAARSFNEAARLDSRFRF